MQTYIIYVDCPSCPEYLALRSFVIANDNLLHFDANISLSSDEQAGMDQPKFTEFSPEHHSISKKFWGLNQ